MPREKSLTNPTPRRPAPRKTMPKVAPTPVIQPASPPATFVDPEQRARLIAETAYYRAERRGFAPGHDVEDWLSAEADVDARLLQGAAATGAQPAS